MNDAFPFEASTDPRRKLTPEVLDLANSNGYPIVASQFVRRDRAGLMLGGSLALLLGAATLFAMSNNRTSIAKIVPPPSPAAPIQTLPAPVTAPVVQNLPPAPAVVPAPLVQPPLPTPVPNPQIALNIAADRGRAPTLIFDNSPGERPVVQAAAATPAPATAKATPQGLSVEESFAQRVGGEGDTASATRMANPGMTVAQGTLMSAVLETAIDSDLPGYVRAIISRDVKSYDGSRVLIPRSSHVIGQYKSELAVGQTRAYVLWTRLLTPDGVSIALGSPATDSAGRNGLSGKVSSHFGKRFGSAILLSVIGAAGQAVGGGGGAVIVAGPQAAASSSAQRDINIPPTVRVSQGQPIRIFTARDLDFSTVTP